ncbi:MAG: phosphoribosylglycinamide formyltransferase [Chloroflexota bacterium]
MMTKPARLVVLISGNGSNLQALLDACQDGRLPARVLGVLSNRGDAYGLQRAERRHIPTLVFYQTGSRAEYDADLAELVAIFQPDWVILAGWMRVLSMNFLRHFPRRVINLHPALPGQFPGVHAIERAFEAYRRGQIDQTGIMVHLVPDEGIDNGPVLVSRTVPIHPDDTLDSLESRIHAAEHELLVDTVRRLITGELEPPGTNGE